jgi:hypothetical protein
VHNRDPHARRVLLFDALDTLEGMRLLSFEQMCRAFPGPGPGPRSRTIPTGCACTWPAPRPTRPAPGRRSAGLRAPVPTCPVRAVRAWTVAAGLTDGPLLRSVDRAGRVGTGRMAISLVYRVPRRVGACAGIDLSRSPPSLRRGHITTAATAGASEREIARTSRHASLVVLRGYIDDAELFRDPSSNSSHLGL